MDSKDTIKAEPLVTTRVPTQVTAPAVPKKTRIKRRPKRLTLQRPASRAMKIRPVIGDGNTIAALSPSSASSAAIDVRISINKLDVCDGRRRKVPVVLTDGFDDRTFIALFDDKDTDFEIKVDNRSPALDVWMDITYGTKRPFIIKRRSHHIFNTFEDCGHRLRFMTPNRPNGRSFKDMFPAGEIGANTKIESVSNRVTIALSVGRQLRQLSIAAKPKAKKGNRKQPSVITVNVKLKKPDRTVRVTIDGHKTVGDLKRLLAAKYAPDADGEQRLVFDGKDLDDEQRVDASGLRNNSTIVAFRVRRECVEEDRRVIYFKSERVYDVETLTRARVGEPGLASVGPKTTVKLGPPVDFKWNRRYAIESFDVELRLRHQYEKRIPAFLAPAVANQ